MSKSKFTIEHNEQLIEFEISDLSSTFNIIFEVNNVLDAIDHINKEENKGKNERN